MSFRAARRDFGVHGHRSDCEGSQDIARGGVEVHMSGDERGGAFAFGCVIGSGNARVEKIEQMMGVHAGCGIEARMIGAADAQGVAAAVIAT